MNRVIVTLEAKHIAYADEVARKRHENAKRYAIKGGNGGPEATTGGAALAIDLLGARGECAGYLWLSPIKWHVACRGYEFLDLPDLGDFIDAKTVGNSRHRLIVKQNEPDGWAYLLVNGERHPEYAIEGWLWGHEAKQPEYLRDPVGGRAAFFVPVSALRHPDSLKALKEQRA